MQPMPIAIAKFIVALIAMVSVEPKIDLQFNSWLSLSIILGLLIAFLSWVLYIALSVRHIRGAMGTMMTKEEMHREFAAFKRELEDGK